MADDALVNQMKFLVGTGARDVARIIDRVASFEQRHIRPNGLDDTRRIIADNTRAWLDRVLGRAHFCVDRVHRNRFDADQNIVALRAWRFERHIKKRIWIFDR